MRLSSLREIISRKDRGVANSTREKCLKAYHQLVQLTGWDLVDQEPSTLAFDKLNHMSRQLAAFRESLNTEIPGWISLYDEQLPLQLNVLTNAIQRRKLTLSLSVQAPLLAAGDSAIGQQPLPEAKPSPRHHTDQLEAIDIAGPTLAINAPSFDSGSGDSSGDGCCCFCAALGVLLFGGGGAAVHSSGDSSNGAQNQTALALSVSSRSLLEDGHKRFVTDPTLFNLETAFLVLLIVFLAPRILVSIAKGLYNAATSRVQDSQNIWHAGGAIFLILTVGILAWMSNLGGPHTAISSMLGIGLLWLEVFSALAKRYNRQWYGCPNPGKTRLDSRRLIQLLRACQNDQSRFKDNVEAYAENVSQLAKLEWSIANPICRAAGWMWNCPALAGRFSSSSETEITARRGILLRSVASYQAGELPPQAASQHSSDSDAASEETKEQGPHC